MSMDKPTLHETLHEYLLHRGSSVATLDLVNELEAAIAAAIREAAPEKRKLYEPVTKHEVKEGGAATIDLLMDKKGSLIFIQDNGYNQAIDEYTASLTARLGIEKETE
jgi:hypothetical protein